MATSQAINSARLNKNISKTTGPHLRVDVGVVYMKRAPDHLGWRLVTAAVRWYRPLSLEGRALLHAGMIAVLLALILLCVLAQ